MAAIVGINPEIFEAAEMDGIDRLHRIWHMTIPSFKSVIIIMLILNNGSIINDDFEQVFNLLNAKVLDVGDVISTYTYNEGLAIMNFSYLAAAPFLYSEILGSMKPVALLQPHRRLHRIQDYSKQRIFSVKINQAAGDDKPVLGMGAAGLFDFLSIQIIFHPAKSGGQSNINANKRCKISTLKC